MNLVPRPVYPFTIAGATIWLSALATLAILSFLYRDNRIFRIAEHILLGLAIGFLLAATITDILIPKWWQPLTAGWRDRQWGAVAISLLASAFGLMWYGLYHRKTVWLARIVIGLTIGAGAGIAFKAEVNDKLPQIIASFKPPYVPAAEATAYNNSFANAVFLVILLSVLSYFFFSFRRQGRLIQATSRSGRVFLMITFGIFFGNTVMTRMSVFIERIWFLLTQWLRVGNPG